MTMTTENLDTILDNHALWLETRGEESIYNTPN